MQDHDRGPTPEGESLGSNPSAPVEGSEDSELVARCLRAGQDKDDAFAALYARHSPRVFGFLLKLTHSRSAAEDALQETFLRVYRSLDRFDARRELGAWLLQIARYVAIDAFRVERKVKRLEERRAADQPEEQTSQSVSAAAEGAERRRVVNLALEQLSPEDRSLLLLRHYQDLTFRQIGEIVDCSSRTAQNRVGAAGRRFQEALRAHHRVGEGEL
jgi:RNA polymerase sigma-70 factor, ECF subfamily